MKTTNVNCKGYDNYGFCNLKPKRFFGLFKEPCPEVDLAVCSVAERFPRPQSPPPSPMPRISEDEAKVRDILSSAIRLNISPRSAKNLSLSSNNVMLYLTNQECVNIARNCPYSAQEIRTLFPFQRAIDADRLRRAGKALANSGFTTAEAMQNFSEAVKKMNDAMPTTKCWGKYFVGKNRK